MLKYQNSQAARVRVMVRCLLLLWLFFGGLELAEQLQFVLESGVEDQEGQDQDEAALSQLASGLKSSIHFPELPHSARGLTPASATFLASSDTLLQVMQLVLHLPPTLALYQQYSVYRI